MDLDFICNLPTLDSSARFILPTPLQTQEWIKETECIINTELYSYLLSSSTSIPIRKTHLPYSGTLSLAQQAYIVQDICDDNFSGYKAVDVPCSMGYKEKKHIRIGNQYQATIDLHSPSHNS